MARAWSIHIGVNDVDPAHYVAKPPVLEAAEHDADDMATLSTTAGFELRALLEGPKATRSAVLGHIREAAEALQDGDIFLLSASCHGSVIPDRGQDERDGYDSTWCLYDGQLVDDELAVEWSRFAAGVRILMISDSCHSQTMLEPFVPQVRSRGVRSRALSPAAAFRIYEHNRAFYEAIERREPAPPIVASARILAACRDDELAFEDDYNGHFTGALKLTWNRGRFSGDYEHFMSRIREYVPAGQRPQHGTVGVRSRAYDRQRPFTI